MAAANFVKPGWVASFTEAKKAQEKGQGTKAWAASQEYNCGNNNSEAFFRKIAASHAESQRLRQQCRAAAKVSAARHPEEKVKLDHFEKSIDTAVAVSQYSRTVRTAAALGSPLVVPPHLGHLILPEATMPLMDSARSPIELSLPGALEPLAAGEDGLGAGPGQVLGGHEAPREPLRPAAVSYPLDEGEGSRELGAADEDELDGFGEDDEDEDTFKPAAPAPAAASSSGAHVPGLAPPAQQAETKKSSDLASSEDEDDEDDDEEDDETESDGWPPKPPLLRFKMRIQFSSRFKPSESDELIKGLNKDISSKFTETSNVEVKDMTVGWINKVFAMNIVTEFQFEVSFPIIILTMLDAIYTRRVRWREVDWRYQYKNALQKNYAVLEKIWYEVNMEKAREFRVENTPLRMENMFGSTMQEKLEFIRIMKRWYDQRHHHADAYEPMVTRREIVTQCRTSGVAVKFPPWIQYDKEEPLKKPESYIKDTWRVRSKAPVPVLAQQAGDAASLCTKKFGESFKGYQDGDWVCLLDEPGCIVRIRRDTREKLLEKQEKFRIISKAPAPVRAAKSSTAKQLGTKKCGDIVCGYLEDRWVELTGEAGYMDMFTAGSAERVLENCSVEDYNKMPEYKRLIWFLGSTEHQTM